MHIPHFSPSRPQRAVGFTLALMLICIWGAPSKNTQAAHGLVPADSASPVHPLDAVAELRQRLVFSREPNAQARLADLDRLLETARSLRRSDGQPIEVRFRYRALSDGVEAEVTAVSDAALEISLNESCSARTEHIAVSYLHELTHVAQFAEGRLGYAPSKTPGATRWQAVGNDAVDEAEAYAESFWIVGTSAINCPENLWGFLAAYHEGWNTLLDFVRQERPTLPAYELRPPRDGALLLSNTPYAELSLRWFHSSLMMTTKVSSTIH